MDQLKLREISKQYDGAPLLRGLSMDVESGEILCLLGRSGSGKSTLLRIIAGLEQAESGKIFWNDVDVSSTPTHLRKFGLMFQDYALFPHLDVAKNVAFGLEMQRLPASKIDSLVRESLRRVNMEVFAKRSVTELSGGEQQRVALARSLAAQPRLLMLDEPLAALDRSLRLELQHELKELLHQAGIPVIYVTHDQEEAISLGDRLAILHDGAVVQNGTPETVFANPVNRWVAEFLGMENIIEGRVIGTKPLHVTTPIGEFALTPHTESQFSMGLKVSLVLKTAISLSGDSSIPGNLISGKVIDSSFRQEGYLVSIDLGLEKALNFMLPEPAAPGTKLTLKIPPSSISLYSN